MSVFVTLSLSAFHDAENNLANPFVRSYRRKRYERTNIERAIEESELETDIYGIIKILIFHVYADYMFRAQLFQIGHTTIKNSTKSSVNLISPYSPKYTK